MARVKVFWTEAEKRAIVLKALEIREAKLPESPLHLFREAMRHLPQGRRRRVRSLAEVPWFIELMSIVLKERAETGSVCAYPAAQAQEVTGEHVELLVNILAELRRQSEMIHHISRNIESRQRSGTSAPAHRSRGMKTAPVVEPLASLLN